MVFECVFEYGRVEGVIGINAAVYVFRPTAFSKGMMAVERAVTSFGMQ